MEGREEMGDVLQGGESKPATAARIYDYHLGGTHNFPADRAAGKAIADKFPMVPAIARSNRAFLRRAVRFLVGSGVRQLLDVGSGIPTSGNVHEVAQAIEPQTRVVYVDIDPVAVAESQELLEGNEFAAAIRGDLGTPRAILEHPQVRRLIDFDQPVGLLLLAVLHFIPEDDKAYEAVAELLAALPTGSYLVVSHAGKGGFDVAEEDLRDAKGIYRRQTATPFTLRTSDEVKRFFAGLELVEPGVVWLPRWRPDPDEPDQFDGEPRMSAGLCAVGRLA